MRDRAAFSGLVREGCRSILPLPPRRLFMDDDVGDDRHRGPDFLGLPSTLECSIDTVERLRLGRSPWGARACERRGDRTRGEVEDVLHFRAGERATAVIGISDRLLGHAVHARLSPPPVCAAGRVDDRALHGVCTSNLVVDARDRRGLLRITLEREVSGLPCALHFS